ncbi:hypothetical protein F442_22822 [Phytophthora nicotianae P10297]|uniref:Uncharacterized protein n=1 Tax=Phytophthora nicotianae P10297 TaxID=1317064 RepID=W2XZS7_PHYNI|nr:hypothetical protein F442_22822 [Phytophthora nicotianae P10297]
MLSAALGQLDLLVRMQPYGSHPVAMPPPMDLQLPAAPQYPAYPTSGAGRQHLAVSQPPAASQRLAATQPSSDPAQAPQGSPKQGPGRA